MSLSILVRWSSLVAIVVTAIISFAIATWTESQVAITRDHWQQALHQANTITATLERLPIHRDGAPQPDQVAIVARRILVTAGVPQEAFVGIQPLGDTLLPGGTWHRQQVLLQLHGLTTAQTAAVIDALGRQDHAWSASSVQLNHAGNGDVFDAGIALTTLYPAAP